MAETTNKMPLKPDIRVKSAYSLPFELLKENGIKILLFDLDNTIASFYETFEDRKEMALALKERCEKEGFEIALASNGKGKRVKTFCREWGVTCYPMMMKPFSYKLKKLIKEKGWDKKEVALIGDQLMTDMKAAKHAGIFFVLTDKLVTEEPFFTRINRFFEKPMRKKINKMPYDILIKEGD